MTLHKYTTKNSAKDVSSSAKRKSSAIVFKEFKWSVFLPAHWSSSNSFLHYFEVLLSNICVVLFALACLFHFGPSWCGAQLRTNGIRGDWGTVGSLGPLTGVAENQSLMHPFLLSKWGFLSHCFLLRSRQKMREPGKGCLEDGHICVKRKDLGKEQKWIL